MKKKLVKNGIPRSWIMIFYPHYMKGRKKSLNESSTLPGVDRSCSSDDPPSHRYPHGFCHNSDGKSATDFSPPDETLEKGQISDTIWL